MTEDLTQATENQIKDLIVEIVKKQKPETAKQLVSLIQETQDLPEKEITKLLIKLENEDKLLFTKKEPPTPATIKEYIFSSKVIWYWTTIALTAMTTAAAFTIPQDAVPLIYLRSALSIIFVLFLPGLTLMKMLFLSNVPINTSSENMETIELFALSIVLSLGLVTIVGLILNYTPWGIRFIPMTLSLLALTIVFATTAVLREYQAKAQVVKISA